ncbi:MAG: hypothetical protein H7256_02015 [Bdellovibrio sp.]|nr:hypothetical protein [Bdellovibrio sp.]
MKLVSLLCVCLLSSQVFASDKSKEKTVREPAARTKKAKALTCSNAAGDGGYTITIFDYKRATILENNIAGAKIAANLSCGLLPIKNPIGSSGADMIHTFLSCSSEDNSYKVTVNNGGFAGLVEADLTVPGSAMIEDILCK